MRNIKNNIIVVTLFSLLISTLFVCIMFTYDFKPHFSYTINGDVFDTYYDSHNGAVYLFLPSWSENTTIEICDDRIVLDGKKLKSKMSINDYIDKNVII